MNCVLMLLSKKVINRFFLILCVIISTSLYSKAGVCDSIGVERKNGKLFVLHRIAAGETLYSLSRKYNVSVDEIKQNNPEVASGLKVGQVLYVPSNAVVPAASTTTAVAGAQKHTVAAGETLYSIATKYAISVDELKKANPGLTNSISVGQQLNLPSKSAATTTKPANTKPENTTKPVVSKQTIEHKVESGETMYSIARKYNVSVEDIKKANPGVGSLKVGQTLKIVGAEVAQTAGTTTTPVKPATTTTTTTTTTANTTKPAATTNPEADTIQLQQDKVKLETMQQTQTTPTKPTVPASDFKKITESGFADLMADNQDTPKYLAYHKTAPVGTIIQLSNESTGVKVYVRVIGKLTDTGTDGKTIIRISKKAYERLGGTGTRFSATLMYIP